MDILPILLGLSILLTVVTYFLAENGKINSFPTYLAGTAFLMSIFAGLRVRTFFRDPTVILSLILLLYLTVSVSWSENNQYSNVFLYLGYAILLAGFLYGIPLLQCRLTEFVDHVITITILSAVVSCIYSIYLYHALPNYEPLVEDRLYALGRLHSPAISAMSYSIVAVFCLHRTAIGERSNSILWLLASSILLYGIFLTGTRSVWIGMLVAAAVSLCFTPHLMRSTKLYIGLACLFCLILMSCVVWFTGYYEDLWRRSTSFRPEIWATFWQKVLADNILIGSGANAPSEIQPGQFVFDHPHSIYLATLYYGGMIGLLLLFSLLGSAVYRLLHAPTTPLRSLALTSMAFSLVTMAFDGDRLLVKVEYTWFVFWLPLALSFCVIAEEYRQDSRT